MRTRVEGMMDLMGIERVDRPDPDVVVDLDSVSRMVGCYSPSQHVIRVSAEAPACTLAHEWCHALQVRREDTVYLSSGDVRGYLHCREEEEAYAVEGLWDLYDAPWLAELAAIVGHDLGLAKWAQRVDQSLRTGSFGQMPAPLPRSKRLAVNALIRKYS